MRYQIVALLSCIVCACSDRGEPAPMFLSVEELATMYEQMIGDEVILVGQLVSDTNGAYFLAYVPTSAPSTGEDGFRVRLKFAKNNLDRALMEPCVGVETSVVGYVDADRVIRVQWVKRTSDVRIHATTSCYTDS